MPVLERPGKQNKPVQTRKRIIDKCNLCVKLIYLDLINPDELKKCLHGKTQNQNESFNAMIWERVPKITYCANDKLELAVYDASVNFNEGRQAQLIF